MSARAGWLEKIKWRTGRQQLEHGRERIRGGCKGWARTNKFHPALVSVLCAMGLDGRHIMPPCMITDFQKKFSMLADVQSAKVVIEHRIVPEYQKSTMRQILASSILIFTRETWANWETCAPPFWTISRSGKWQERDCICGARHREVEKPFWRAVWQNRWWWNTICKCVSWLRLTT